MRSSFSVVLCVGVALAQLLGGAICSPLQAEQAAPDSGADVLVSIEAVPEVGAFRRAHPELGAVPLQSKVRAEEGAAGRLQIVYTLGARQGGDRLVGLSSDNKSWASPQDVTLNLQYPTAGVGAVVTYVEVVVQQSTVNGRAYVVSGGVGQRGVRLGVEAYGTVYFNYSAAIYGY